MTQWSQVLISSHAFRSSQLAITLKFFSSTPRRVCPIENLNHLLHEYNATSEKLKQTSGCHAEGLCNEPRFNWPKCIPTSPSFGCIDCQLMSRHYNYSVCLEFIIEIEEVGCSFCMHSLINKTDNDKFTLVYPWPSRFFIVFIRNASHFVDFITELMRDIITVEICDAMVNGQWPGYIIWRIVMQSRR